MGADNIADLAAIGRLQDRAGQRNGGRLEFGDKILHILVVCRILLVGGIKAEKDVGKGIHVIIVFAKLRFLFPDSHYFAGRFGVSHPPCEIFILGDGFIQVGLDIFHLLEGELFPVFRRLVEYFRSR